MGLGWGWGVSASRDTPSPPRPLRQCVNELNQWLSALRKVCGNNPQLLCAYHPGVFRGDKWTCCHQKDKTGMGGGQDAVQGC